MQPYRQFVFSALTLMLSACTLGPDHQPPAFPFANEWFGLKQGESTLAAQQDETHLEKWWVQFDDPLLTQLIAQATEENKEIREAIANVAQAKALRQSSAASFYPSIRAELSGERTGNSRLSRDNSFSAGERERDTLSAALDVTWELDIFGRTRRSVEAAEATLQATQANRHGIVLAVLAETASTYFQLRGLQKHIAITERNIALLREVETLARSRYETGDSTEFDYARARGERQAIEAQLPDLQAQMKTAMYRIAILTGKPPEQQVKALQEASPLPAPKDPVPVGLRSDLLKRRPDIRQAERELAAATARIGIAEASLLPDLSLTGSIGTRARYFSDLFLMDGFTYVAGTLLSLPLFEGGALRAEIAASDAQAQAALARYEHIVLRALEEVESALLRYGKEWQTLQKLRAVQDSREKAFRIARLRYEAGEEEFLVILDAERTLIDVRNDIIASEIRILTSLTQLYKALGGGWQPTTETT